MREAKVEIFILGIIDICQGIRDKPDIQPIILSKKTIRMALNFFLLGKSTFRV